MRRCVELDDRSLVDIFSRVADAHQLAKCSLVCRRWHALRWSVSRMQFQFLMANFKDLMSKEAIIARVLRRTKKEAPGCLKYLKVLLTVALPAAARCYWLVHAADSVREVELDLSGFDASLWSLLSVCNALEIVKLTGFSADDSFVPMANESPFTRLTSCSVTGVTATAALLEAIVAACPALRELRFVRFEDDSRTSLEVVSSSLEYLELYGGDAQEEKYVVSLNIPRLKVLKAGIGMRPMKLRITSTEDLSELALCGSCYVYSQTPFGKLKKLTLSEEWTTDLMLAIVELTSSVTELRFENFSSGYSDAVPLGRVLFYLPNLRTVHFDGVSLQAFNGHTDLLAFEALTVHVWVNKEKVDRDLSIYKNLLRVVHVQMLVVHYTLLEIRDMDKEWGLFLNLELLFPGRVKFKYEDNDNDRIE